MSVNVLCTHQRPLIPSAGKGDTSPFCAASLVLLVRGGHICKGVHNLNDWLGLRFMPLMFISRSGTGIKHKLFCLAGVQKQVLYLTPVHNVSECLPRIPSHSPWVWQWQSSENLAGVVLEIWHVRAARITCRWCQHHLLYTSCWWLIWNEKLEAVISLLLGLGTVYF